jgi:multidrug resistance efflux pump
MSGTLEQSHNKLLASQRLTQIELQNVQLASQLTELKTKLASIDASIRANQRAEKSRENKKRLKSLQEQRLLVNDEILHVSDLQAALSAEAATLASQNGMAGTTLSTATSNYSSTSPLTPSKSKTTAAILAILLGTFGAHHFYLGHTIWGIIYLVFCWTFIPTVLGVVEGILYLVRSNDSWLESYPPEF